VRQYAELMTLVKTVQAEVKNNGLSGQTPWRLQEVLGAYQQGRWAGLFNEVMRFLGTEASQVPAGQKWLGSSDLIESLFGVYKYASEAGPFPEIGANVLLLPVMTAPLSGAETRHSILCVQCTIWQIGARPEWKSAFEAARPGIHIPGINVNGLPLGAVGC